MDDIYYEEVRLWYRVEALGRRTYIILGALCGKAALWATPWGEEGKFLVMDEAGDDYEIVTGGEAQALFKDVDRADDALAADLDFAMIGLGTIVDHVGVAYDRRTVKLEARARLQRQTVEMGFAPASVPANMELPL